MNDCDSELVLAHIDDANRIIGNRALGIGRIFQHGFDVIEEYGAGGIPDKTRKLGKRRPRGGSVWLLAVAGRLRRAAGIRRDRCSKMHNVPLDRTQRVLMIHMDVIEPLDLAGLSIFDQRIVWASKIPKTSLARRRDSLGA